MKNTICIERVPAELRDRPQWVLWRQEEVAGRLTKVPYRTAGGKASSTDPATWSSFAAALAASQNGNGYDGIGYVFSPDDPYTGVDLDKCLDQADELLPWARDAVLALDSYTERSHSRRGLHVIVKARLPEGCRHKATNVNGTGADFEVYDQERYFIFTGDALDWTPAGVNERQPQLDELLGKMFPKGPTRPKAARRSAAEQAPAPTATADDLVLIEKIRAGEYGAGARCLWNGDLSHYGDDDSGADYALCKELFSIVGNDSGRVERLFRFSGLMRPKWDERRGDSTYGRDTLENARLEWREAGAKQARPKYRYTDLGNGERLAARFGRDLHHFRPWRMWYVWNGERWEEDTTGQLNRMAKETVRAIYGEAEHETDSDERRKIVAHALKSESSRGVEAMIDQCWYLPGIPITAEAMDADPWLLNCRNGTIDLQTGTLQPHRRDDLITKQAPVDYDPNACSATWSTFLARIVPDAEVRADLQRLIGYCLTGVVRDHVLPILYGTGANGKSTFLEAVAAAMGDYARTAAPEILIDRGKQQVHTTELTDLKGARLVVTNESEKNRKMAIALFKKLTGGDTITARRMHQNDITWRPTHKILFATNHRPEIPTTDDGTWRRLQEIPFEVTIPAAEQDKTLGEKLRGELPGILAWAVQGCLEWQRIGLQPPTAVETATASYREREDQLAAFIADRCRVGTLYESTSVREMHTAFKQWCADTGERSTLTERRLSEAMRDRGYATNRRSCDPNKGKSCFVGIGLAAASEEGEVSEAISHNSYAREIQGKNMESASLHSPISPDDYERVH